MADIVVMTLIAIAALLIICSTIRSMHLNK